MRRARRRIATRLALALALCPFATLAQSYGDQDQTLTLSVAHFRNGALAGSSLQSDGYLYGADTGPDEFRAPLPLPEGAELRQICMYANDPAPAQVSVSVVAVKLVPGGGGPATVTIPNTAVASTGTIGYGYYCTGPLSFTMNDVFDVDGDGTPDAVVYYLQAQVPASSTGLGGVRVTWRRQVSPAPATPTFGDVPAGDGGFPFIEAMAASAITGGCGGGNYCPGAHVTRRQMAIFLAKALGLHWGTE